MISGSTKGWPYATGALLSSAILLCAAGGCYTPTHATRADFVRAFSSRPRAELALAGRAPLTLAEAEELALRSSPELEVLRAAKRAAVADVEAAGLPRNPELRVGGLSVDDAVRGDVRADVRLRVEPPRPLENGARVAEAEAASRNAEADLSAAEWATTAEVRRLFLLAGAAHRESEAARDVQAKLAARTRAVASGVESGSRTSKDLAEARIAESKATNQALVYAAEERRTLGELAARLGVDPGPNGLSLAAIPTPAPPSLEACTTESLTKSPSVERWLARVDGASARRDREETRRFPWLSFVDIGYELAPDREGPLGFFFGLGITVPVFDTGAPATRAAERRIEWAERGASAELQTIASRVESAYRTSLEADRALRAHRGDLREAREAAKRESTALLEAGRIDQAEALLAESDLALHALEEARLEREALEAAASLAGLCPQTSRPPR